MLNISQIRRAFNDAARTVRQADVLSSEIAERLIERLPLIRLEPQSVLECGAGVGCLTASLADYYPKAKLVALDVAEQQLRQTQPLRSYAVTSHFSTLPFVDNSFDMVVSSLRLNWANDLAACFREFKRVLKPNGLLMFTMLGVETLKELRESFITCQQHFHRFPDMHDVGDLLLQTGFEDPVMDMETLTIRYKKLRTLFEDLKYSGLGNAHQHRPKHLFGKERWQQAIARYEALKAENIYWDKDDTLRRMI